MDSNQTQPKRPVPVRPQWGWFAWEATVGYIHEEYSPDAMLTVQMYPSNGIVMWGASLTWANIQERVNDRLGFAFVLGDLWHEVASHHQLFRSLESAVRRPDGYDDDQWVDDVTLDVLTRLVGLSSTVFLDDWSLMINYRPVDKPNDRVQARLVAKNNRVVRGGQGPTLRDACRNLYHNATPDFKQYKQE